MNVDLLLENLTNPALLFFVLGVISVIVKSDLEIPSNSAKFISIYLLFSIGFKGGQELSHEEINAEIALSFILAIVISAIIPLYSFFILKSRLGVGNAAAIAAAYGSVSAVTFVTAVSYLESHNLNLNGHMVAVMGVMETPAIIVGLLLYSTYSKSNTKNNHRLESIRHAITNSSVMLITGSLIIGYFANAKQAEGIKPFTNDIFKGFLAVFLLDMGINSGRKLKDLFSFGWFPLVFAIAIPLFNGAIVAIITKLIFSDVSNSLMFAVLASSASYIAVPAAVKISIKEANPGLYLPMALAITFPINITLGFPFYHYLATL